MVQQKQQSNGDQIESGFSTLMINETSTVPLDTVDNNDNKSCCGTAPRISNSSKARSSKKYRTTDQSQNDANSNNHLNNKDSELIQLKRINTNDDKMGQTQIPIDQYQLKLKVIGVNSEQKSNSNCFKQNRKNISTTTGDSSKNNKCLTSKRIKRPLPCLFAWLILLSATAVYFGIIVNSFYEMITNDDIYYYWISIFITQIVVFIFTAANFLIAIFRDPGRFKKIYLSPDDPANDDTKYPLYKNIMIKNVSVKTKWCSVSLV
jgi:hypothetical protein